MPCSLACNFFTIDDTRFFTSNIYRTVLSNISNTSISVSCFLVAKHMPYRLTRIFSGSNTHGTACIGNSTDILAFQSLRNGVNFHVICCFQWLSICRIPWQAPFLSVQTATSVLASVMQSTSLLFERFVTGSLFTLFTVVVLFSFWIERYSGNFQDLNTCHTFQDVHCLRLPLSVVFKLS